MAPSLHPSAIMHPPWPLVWTPAIALVIMAVYLRFRRQHAVPLSSAEHLSTVALAHVLVLLSLHQSVARLGDAPLPMTPLFCAGALAAGEVNLAAILREPVATSVTGAGGRQRWQGIRSAGLLWLTRVALLVCSLYVVECALVGDSPHDGERTLVLLLVGALTGVLWGHLSHLPRSVSTMKPLLIAFLWGVAISALALRGNASTVCVVGLTLGCAALLWRGVTPRGEPAAEGSLVALTAALWFMTTVEQGG